MAVARTHREAAIICRCRYYMRRQLFSLAQRSAALDPFCRPAGPVSRRQLFSLAQRSAALDPFVGRRGPSPVGSCFPWLSAQLPWTLFVGRSVLNPFLRWRCFFSRVRDRHYHHHPLALARHARRWGAGGTASRVPDKDIQIKVNSVRWQSDRSRDSAHSIQVGKAH